MSTFHSLPKELIEEIEYTSKSIEVPSGQILVSMGDTMDYVPFVQTGTVRVFVENEDVNKELLLYYVDAGQTCMMSIIASFTGRISKVSAMTESASKVFLMPAPKIREWQVKYEEFNDLIIDLFVNRYTDLLQTIEALSFQKIEDRLMTYFNSITKSGGHISHQKTHAQIAKDIATSREVITRTLKKLENEGKIAINKGQIQVLG